MHENDLQNVCVLWLIFGETAGSGFDEGGSPISPAGGRVLFFGGNLKGGLDPENRDGVYLWDEKAGAISYVASR